MRISDWSSDVCSSDLAEGAREIVLDTKGLDVRSVTNGQGQMLPWKLGAADENLGAPLTVQLNGAKQIRVTYRSAPDAAALQWLAPEQTSGQKYQIGRAHV